MEDSSVKGKCYNRDADSWTVNSYLIFKLIVDLKILRCMKICYFNLQ